MTALEPWHRLGRRAAELAVDPREAVAPSLYARRADIELKRLHREQPCRAEVAQAALMVHGQRLGRLLRDVCRAAAQRENVPPGPGGLLVVPRAIIIGTLAIVGIYLAANAAYLYVSPVETVATSPLIAADTMQALFGQIGVAFVAVVVTISTLGALIAIMLSAPRIFFAMADDKLFFQAVARVHP